MKKLLGAVNQRHHVREHGFGVDVSGRLDDTLHCSVVCVNKNSLVGSFLLIKIESGR